jgi:hypothetical protein
MVSVDCQAPLLVGREDGLRLHVGASVGDGDTAHVSVVAESKPLSGLSVIVEVDEPPGLTDEGLAGVDEKVKSAVAVPVPES